jgi:hypothetical protein
VTRCQFHQHYTYEYHFSTYMLLEKAAKTRCSDEKFVCITFMKLTTTRGDKQKSVKCVWYIVTCYLGHFILFVIRPTSHETFKNTILRYSRHRFQCIPCVVLRYLGWALTTFSQNYQYFFIAILGAKILCVTWASM